MAVRSLRYSVGNENNPADPWGRSDLVVRADGSARLDHHFSRGAGARAWIGRIDAVALDELWAALDRAGFPELAVRAAAVPDAAICTLSVEADGTARQLLVTRHQAGKLPGYAEAFDLLDGAIRQLSQDAVSYPTTRQAIVRDVTAL